jgi:hypothetical protein
MNDCVDRFASINNFNRSSLSIWLIVVINYLNWLTWSIFSWSLDLFSHCNSSLWLIDLIDSLIDCFDRSTWPIRYVFVIDQHCRFFRILLWMVWKRQNMRVSLRSNIDCFKSDVRRCRSKRICFTSTCDGHPDHIPTIKNSMHLSTLVQPNCRFLECGSQSLEENRELKWRWDHNRGANNSDLRSFEEWST